MSDPIERYERILLDCDFGDWAFIVGTDGDRHYLQMRFILPQDAWSPKPFEHRGRKWLLSPHMTTSEIVQTALKAVLTVVEHEARERFRYQGQAIFGPHYNVDSLVALCRGGAIDKRKEAP